MTEKEKVLLAGCVSGDKGAWDTFVQQYSGLIYHTIKTTAALHHGKTPPDFADDLFQDTFLSLVKDDFMQLRRFRGDHGCTLASWLRMIAARRTIDHLRKLNKPESPLDESLSDVTADVPKGEQIDAPLQLLASAMAKLQPQERIIIDLFYRQNLSAQDVAAILHLSVGAVYTQKSRILAKLREALEKSGSQ